MAISTAVDLSAVARVVGIKTQYKDLRDGGILYLPQRVAVVAQGSTDAVYDSEKRRARCVVLQWVYRYRDSPYAVAVYGE